MAATVTRPKFDTRAEQTWDALRKANETRLMRVQLKRDIRASTTSVVDYLLDPPEFTWNMPVDELLGAQPRWGTVKVGKLLGPLHISTNRRIGKLTPRQRQLLAERIR